jgi:hypothetical protein
MNPDFLDSTGKLVDFYSLFNVSYSATAEEIRSSFRALIRRYHPDIAGISENAGSKVELIIRGYRILSDEDLRLTYDRALFDHQVDAPDRYPVISNKRIRYSASLKEMLKVRFLPRGMKRKDLLKNFGQDVEILVTPLEKRRGAVARVSLPARMMCPLCQGSNPECHVCRGLGQIGTTSQLEVRIPPHVDDSTRIDVDLTKIHPDRFTVFRHGHIRIKITIIDPDQARELQ